MTEGRDGKGNLQESFITQNKSCVCTKEKRKGGEINSHKIKF